MSYVEGFILAVPADRREDYRRHAEEGAALLRQFGAIRIVEAWGDDVKEGKWTDFRRAVKAEEGEDVMFSWMEFPSRAVRDSAFEKMMSDPRMEKMGKNMPFDGKRMVFGGFEVILDIVA
ncbi:hypothetical protein CG51_13690 [Haematobacter missouriensis]|uniref:RNA signal recognition particle n=1 Tax=Haematobacter missouriensis TaxID=366616 RepID=A0A212AU80_9RHOB|nr:DUF1428 domain-containing protein [Haematobacter missouriensis]KFI33344.1 hypothetical protein CG51_13690 [Haematobacter missouriensis]OWJ74695.1 RNA signal recognition particle [Haematobacter missouriensis]OWJ85031.1 RNA signal recognition particle [Haematobacter missouriensis]